MAGSRDSKNIFYLIAQSMQRSAAQRSAAHFLGDV